MNRCGSVRSHLRFRPVTSDVPKLVLAVRPSYDCTVQNMGRFHRVGVDGCDVAPTAGLGVVWVGRAVRVAPYDVRYGHRVLSQSVIPLRLRELL